MSRAAAGRRRVPAAEGARRLAQHHQGAPRRQPRLPAAHPDLVGRHPHLPGDHHLPAQHRAAGHPEHRLDRRRRPDLQPRRLRDAVQVLHLDHRPAGTPAARSATGSTPARPPPAQSWTSRQPSSGSSQATGFRFVYRGTTTGIPQNGANSWYPADTQIVVAWARPSQSSMLRLYPNAVGVGSAIASGGYMNGDGTTVSRIIRGVVVIDSDRHYRGRLRHRHHPRRHPAARARPHHGPEPRRREQADHVPDGHRRRWPGSARATSADSSAAAPGSAA